MTTCSRDDSRSRYQSAIDDEVIAIIGYTQLDDDRVIIDHTKTSAVMRGHGLAGQLTRFALEDLRARHQHVVVHCAYTRHYLDQHPEFADLL